MSTTLTPTSYKEVPATVQDRGPRPALPVTFTGVLRSEWVKLRSVRSTTTTLVATAGTLLFVGAIAAALSGGLIASTGDGGPGGDDPTSTVLAGSLLAPLIIGVLGVILITSEYSTGTIRSTMTMVPKRLPVLWGKAAVLAAVALPVMVVSTLVTFFAGQALLSAGGGTTAAITDPGVLRAVLGTGLYLAGVAVLGLAIGTLLRSTAVAISTLVALLFLLPGLGALLLPASWQDNVLLYLPSNAASSFTSVATQPGLLSPGVGAAVFAAWVAVPLALAAVALKRRPV